MDQEERIIRLEELAYFQEERLRELNEALTAQQQQIDTLEQRLEQYYMPLTFSTDCLDLISNDALTRTQLREVIARCRKFRIDQHWEDAVC